MRDRTEIVHVSVEHLIDWVGGFLLFAILVLIVALKAHAA